MGKVKETLYNSAHPVFAYKGHPVPRGGWISCFAKYTATGERGVYVWTWGSADIPPGLRAYLMKLGQRVTLTQAGHDLAEALAFEAAEAWRG